MYKCTGMMMKKKKEEDLSRAAETAGRRDQRSLRLPGDPV
jgi:hypothetical protein